MLRVHRINQIFLSIFMNESNRAIFNHAFQIYYIKWWLHKCFGELLQHQEMIRFTKLNGMYSTNELHATQMTVKLIQHLLYHIADWQRFWYVVGWSSCKVVTDLHCSKLAISLKNSYHFLAKVYQIMCSGFARLSSFMTNNLKRQ